MQSLTTDLYYKNYLEILNESPFPIIMMPLINLAYTNRKNFASNNPMMKTMKENPIKLAADCMMNGMYFPICANWIHHDNEGILNVIDGSKRVQGLIMLSNHNPKIFNMRFPVMINAVGPMIDLPIKISIYRGIINVSETDDRIKKVNSVDKDICDGLSVSVDTYEIHHNEMFLTVCKAYQQFIEERISENGISRKGYSCE